MKRIKTLALVAVVAAISTIMLSCGSFGQGFMAGLSGYGNSLYGTRPTMSAPGPRGGSLNYLLDPNYAIAQTMAQQQQMNQVNNAIMRTSIQQVQTKEELEYLEFRKYNKKADGSDYTKAEWRTLVGAALQSMKGNVSSNTGSSTSGSGSYRSSTTTTTTRRKCMKLSASDHAHCNGTGTCSRCNGQGRYYETSYGNSRWVTPCNYCGGNGKCRACNGTGYR